ncbi:hypothetical protein H072_2329 [Dactylellina haptotyla CBS 200.50]|uniref:Uncharacterized protein n=1 Tax=Dactylellina haptotyla (strain CBS 200.50) TaxID=1284197 RepID=S8C7E9_DACHA|nr:hypothetical protein H072_2329 [Dactylellina haptotyla CBS 200.50]
MTTSLPGSNALISFQKGGDGGGGFSNSGQIDWITLAGSSVRFTVDVLARLSKAGIEALTLAASYAIFGRFKISHTAELRIQESVNKLKHYSTFNNALFFGFGVRHIVRSLADSSEGLSSIAICAILSDFYGTEYSALILREFFKILNPPSHLTPAIRQWSSYIKTCEGALTYSNFSHHLAHIENLYSTRFGQTQRFKRGDQVQIASALNELANVANGTTAEATFVGGVDCALIATIALWLLDLNIEIRLDATNEVLFRQASSTRIDPQGGYLVIVVFKNFQDATGNPLPNTQISSYHHIRKTSQIFPQGAMTHDPSLRRGVTTRLPWSQTLKLLFGDSLISALSGDPGEKLGCLFGVLMVTTSFEQGSQLFNNILVRFPEGVKYNGYWKYISTTNRGDGLLNTLENWFPEIKNTCFTSSARHTYHRFWDENPDTNVLTVAVDREFRNAMRSILSLKDTLQHTSPLPWSPKKFVYFLLYVSRCLGSCNIDDGILPSRTGLLYIYQECFLEDYTVDSCIWRMTLPSTFDTTAHITTIGNTTIRDIPPMDIAKIIFSNSKRIPALNKSSSMLSAEAVNGLCFASQSIMELTEEHELAGMIHIFPGTIEFGGDHFDRIGDDRGPYPQNDNYSNNVAEKLTLDNMPVGSLDEAQSQYQNYDSAVFAQLIVSDNCPSADLDFQAYHSTLWAHYRLKLGTDRVLNILPAEFTRTILHHTYVDHRCPRACNPDPGALLNKTYKLVPLEAMGTFISFERDEKPDSTEYPTPYLRNLFHLEGLDTRLENGLIYISRNPYNTFAALKLFNSSPVASSWSLIPMPILLGTGCRGHCLEQIEDEFKSGSHISAVQTFDHYYHPVLIVKQYRGTGLMSP